ncbi:MAG: 7-carboxy-7-deazaguanine synthase [Betaproteobacteria bacterium]
MTYSVKEIFYTLQGEGTQAGRAAVFCRFSGCNLWSGREEDRSSAVCQFCDTDFVGTDGTYGGKYPSAALLAQKIAEHWPLNQSNRFVVMTGGEPLLQVDSALIEALHSLGFEIAVETNGTILPPDGIDWLCVSPKAGSHRVVERGQELKLVYPQTGIDPAQFETLDFQSFCLQPMDGPQRQHNTQAAVDYCQAHPRWKLSVQTHKWIGIR